MVVCRKALPLRVNLATLALVVVLYAVFTDTRSELSVELGKSIGVLAAFIASVKLLGRHLKSMPDRLAAAAQAGHVPKDTRCVVYLRAFQNESTPFVIGPKAKYGRYSQKLEVIQAPDEQDIQIPFEAYFASEIEKQLGPFMALGNPEDYLPPEGARRVYSPDEGWMQRFQELAAPAIAIFIEMSRSGNLSWELGQLLKNQWVTKLYVLTRPAPESLTAMAWKTGDWLLRLRGIRRASWSEFAEDLNALGYQVTLGSGMGSGGGV